jgi:RimJ/RimL family protein N-acetyltransferase
MLGEVRTPRLQIRPWQPGDLERLVEIFAKPEVWHFPFGRGFTREETEAFLDRGLEHRGSKTPVPAAAVDLATETLIGYITLSVPDYLPEVMPAIEIGWRLDPPYQGQGLATEGARSVLRYGFCEMSLSEILSIYEPDNVASGRVMEKIGMRFSGDTTHPYFGVPLRIYRLTRAEWEAGG